MATVYEVATHEGAHVIFQVLFGGDVNGIYIVDLKYKGEGRIGVSVLPRLQCNEQHAEMLLAGGIAEAFTRLPGAPSDWLIDIEKSIASLLDAGKSPDPGKNIQIFFMNVANGSDKVIDVNVQELFGEDATLVHNLAPDHSEQWISDRIRAVVVKISDPAFWNAMRPIVEHIERQPVILRDDPTHQQSVQELEAALENTLNSYIHVGVEDSARLCDLVRKLLK